MLAPLNLEQAHAVYDILVQHCGAHESARRTFVDRQVLAYREECELAAGLGIGGAFRRSGCEDRWYVTCYEEDLTAARQQMIDAANAALAGLRERVA